MKILIKELKQIITLFFKDLIRIIDRILVIRPFTHSRLDYKYLVCNRLHGRLSVYT